MSRPWLTIISVTFLVCNAVALPSEFVGNRVYDRTPAKLGGSTGSGSGITTAWPKSVPIYDMCLLSSFGIGTCYAPVAGKMEPNVLCEDPHTNCILRSSTSSLSGVNGSFMNISLAPQKYSNTETWAAVLMDDQSEPVEHGYISTGEFGLDVNRSQGPCHLNGREGLNLTVTDQFLFLCSTNGEGECCPIPPGGGFCTMKPLQVSVFRDLTCKSGWKSSVQFEYSWTASICMIASPKQGFKKDTFFKQAFMFGGMTQSTNLTLETVCA